MKRVIGLIALTGVFVAVTGSFAAATGGFTAVAFATEGRAGVMNVDGVDGVSSATELETGSSKKTSEKTSQGSSKGTSKGDSKSSTKGTSKGTFRGKWRTPEGDIELVMDLYNETVTVPEMEMFGPMNGYMKGKGIYNTWVITSCKVKSETEATLTFSNDLGSETQRATLKLEGDSCFHLREVDGAVFKKVGENRKLIKLPSEFLFNKVR